MNVGGKPMRTIWPERLPSAGEPGSVAIIDQTKLPHRLEVAELRGLNDAARAIRDMLVRGAPLIGATAAYGIALALHDDASDAALEQAHETLLATRPTAVNLRWALDRAVGALRPLPPGNREGAAWRLAAEICDEDVEINRRDRRSTGWT